MKTPRDLLEEAVRELKTKFQTFSDDHLRQEAGELLAFVLEAENGRTVQAKDVALIQTDPQNEKSKVSESSQRRFLGLVRKRTMGVPLQHLTQRQQFLDHRYEVGPDALVPRPETEVLVASLMERIKPVADRGTPLDLLEIGIGSGVISIELLLRFNNLRVLATEASPGALSLCGRNADRLLKGARSRLSLFSVPEDEVFPKSLEAILQPHSFDWIVSNPPYLKGPSETTREVHQFEPHIALYAPAGDSLHFYRQIADHGKRLLKPGGSVAVECPHERMVDILLLFKLQGYGIEVVKDLTGRQRHLFAKLT